MGSYDVNPYKLDSRTKDQFLKDMEKGLNNEVKAIRKLEEILQRSSAIENPAIVYVGSDIEGKVVMDGDSIANVDVFPDYLVKYKNNTHRIRYSLIEVKVCNPHSQYAYFKKKQLEQYVHLGNISILFVMGISTTDPEFIVVEPQEIINLGIEPEMIYGKSTYKIPSSMFFWEKFQAFDRNYNPLIKDYIRR